ncbi:putative regulatory protein [Zafaria cholistanensis]|uniref:Putative regulatory protein n=1 Tax=Zafaria cholistanensis TaxID=1682741 RepID=A0A5A7NRL9_9MICC|nr:PucR family transcriptional regulator ligand-binding domain-containing protein [Zafaria cholistanensis]GER23554.1 putative regulatory protein [Zafaria cholistanensis]
MTMPLRPTTPPENIPNGFSGTATPALTVRTVLALEEIRSGEPELLSGADALDTPVRWVHIADGERVGAILEGGELVLSSGLSFRSPSFHSATQAAARFLEELQAAGAAGAVVELVEPDGTPATAAAAALREAAAGRTLPVVLLKRAVRFVRVTEVVHRMLVGEQLARVERARQLHEVFTELSLQNASEQQIVDRTAELVAAPVVLEDVAHLVLGFAAAGRDPEALLRQWTERSRRVGYREQTGRRGQDGQRGQGGQGEDWLQTPVGVRGRRWGRLVVPAVLEDDADASQVLDRAGQALTIARMAGRDERDLLEAARAGLMHELRQPLAMAEPEARTRAVALGLDPAALYVPVVIRLDRLPGEEPTGLQLRERALLESLGSAVRSARRSMLAAGLHSGSLGVLLGVPARQLEDPLLERVFGELAESAAPSGPHGAGPREPEAQWSVGVGRSRASLVEAAAGLDEATQVADIAATLESRQRRYYRFADVGLRGLLALMRSDPRLRAFAEAELGPLVDPPDPEALALLELYLKHGGNKSALARTGYLSRPALYARLARLQDRLGVSLDDAEARTALHVALLWHRLREVGQAAAPR